MYQSYVSHRATEPAASVVARLERTLECRSLGADRRRRWTKRLAGPAVLVLDAAALCVLLALAWASDGSALQHARGTSSATPAANGMVLAGGVPHATAATQHAGAPAAGLAEK